jgi:hypothetical protein
MSRDGTRFIRVAVVRFAVVMGGSTASRAGRRERLRDILAAAQRRGGAMSRIVGFVLMVAVLNIHPVVAQGANPQPDTGPDDIPCERMESLLFHVHAHLAIYVDGEAQEIPYGIGIGEPWEVIQTSAGAPYVRRGSCFSWLHTHTPDGMLHIEAPIPRSFTLGDFFAVWGEPLSATQVGSAAGPVTAYLNGELLDGDPSDIPLWDREVIQLNVGIDLPPPQPYTFPARYD